MTGVGLNSVGLDQAGSRVGRFLDAPGDKAATLPRGAAAQRGAVVKPFDLRGFRFGNAGARIEVKPLLLLVRQKTQVRLARLILLQQETEEYLAIQEFQHLAAKLLHHPLRVIAAEQPPRRIGQQLRAPLRPLAAARPRADSGCSRRRPRPIRPASEPRLRRTHRPGASKS